MGSNDAPVASGNSKGLTSTPSAACTAACTSTGENANADAREAASLGTPAQAAGTLDTGQDTQDAAVAHQGEGEGIDQGDSLAKLAAALLILSPADRAKLSKLLAEHQDGQKTT